MAFSSIYCLAFLLDQKNSNVGTSAGALQAGRVQEFCTHTYIRACLLGSCIQTGSHLIYTGVNPASLQPLQGQDAARPSRVPKVPLSPGNLPCSGSPTTSRNPDPAPGDPSQGGIIRGEKKEPDSPGPAPAAGFPSRLTSRECRFMSGLFFHPLFGVNLSRAVPAGGRSLTLSLCRQMSV